MDMEHERRLTEVEARSKSNAHRLDEVEKKQDDLSELVGTVKVLADREVRVEKDVKEIKDDVKDLKAKPGKLWEGILEKALYTVVGGIVTYVLVRLGL